METAENLNSYLQTLKKNGKIKTTNTNKLKIEKQNIFGQLKNTAYIFWNYRTFNIEPVANASC